MDLLRAARVGGVIAGSIALVSFDEVSVLSSSKLFEAPDVVVEPVRVGECTGDSLMGDGTEDGESIMAFSLPVTASEIARRLIRGFFIEGDVAM